MTAAQPGARAGDARRSHALSYSSWRRKKLSGSPGPRASFRPRGARSSHWYMPHRPSNKSPESNEIIPENIPLNIVYEDEDVMVINKPPGMVVHPGSGNPNGTLVNALAYYLSDDKENVVETIPRFGLVHRIDKNTSGLLVIAKSEKAMTDLAKQFFDHTVNRRYMALVWGDFEE